MNMDKLQYVLDNFEKKLVWVKQKRRPGGGWINGIFMKVHLQDLYKSEVSGFSKSTNILLLTLLGPKSISIQDIYFDTFSCCSKTDYILFKIELENKKGLYKWLIQNERKNLSGHKNM